jgi:alpha-aminoadipate carrier protein LysW
MRERESKYKCGAACAMQASPDKVTKVEAIMVLCPECESDLDVEEDELDEGEILSCAECGSDFEVVGIEPLELTKVVEEVDPEDAKEREEDGDY